MQQPPQQNNVVEHGRQPCPDRILDDIGGAFGMGAVGGGIWHACKGFINSPKSYKMKGTLEAVRRESPRLGGSFAVWGALFSGFDCTCMYIRQKEDPFNAIMAGALTGGFLQLRAGPRHALRSAAFGGVLLAMIEGLGIALQKMTAPPPPGSPFPAMQGMPGPGGAPGPAGAPPAGPPPSGFEAAGSAAPAADSSSSGGGGGLWSWFGGGEEKPKEPKAQTFTEDFSQPPPMPEFKADDFKAYK